MKVKEKIMNEFITFPRDINVDLINEQTSVKKLVDWIFFTTPSTRVSADVTTMNELILSLKACNHDSLISNSDNEIIELMNFFLVDEDDVTPVDPFGFLDIGCGTLTPTFNTCEKLSRFPMYFNTMQAASENHECANPVFAQGIDFVDRRRQGNKDDAVAFNIVNADSPTMIRDLTCMYPNESIDVLTITNALNFTPYWRDLLNDASKLLKSDGVMYIVDSNCETWNDWYDLQVRYYMTQNYIPGILTSRKVEFDDENLSASPECHEHHIQPLFRQGLNKTYVRNHVETSCGLTLANTFSPESMNPYKMYVDLYIKDEC